MIERKIERITKAGLHQGFLGQGHTAAAVIDGNNYKQTDPFILLMDDHLDLPGGPPVGGPHPHAGFETITLVLEGNGKDWKTGSFELMTAGKGVIHTEEITTQQKLRILQFWLVLPPQKRWTEPHLQQILLEDVPTLLTEKEMIRVYSGTSQGITSPLANQTPFILVDFTLQNNSKIRQELPASFNGFVYVIEGKVTIEDQVIKSGQLGWLDKQKAIEATEVIFKTDSEKARFVFFAGEPHQVSVVHHGPFVGDNHQDIMRLFQEYHSGKIPHLNNLPDKAKIRLKANRKSA